MTVLYPCILASLHDCLVSPPGQFGLPVVQSLLATGTGDIGQSDSVSASASASASTKMSLGDFFGFLSASSYLLSASRELALGTSDDVERCSYAVIKSTRIIRE